MSILGKIFPRDYVYYQRNINSYWSLGAVNRDATAPLYYTFGGVAPSGSLPGLTNLSTRNPDKTLTIPSITSNVFNWSPSVNPGTGVKAYAVNFQVDDNRFSSSARLAVQLDFLFISSKPCDDSDTTCNHPPKFDGNILQHSVIATIPYYYTFNIVDIDNEDMTLEHDVPLPTGMTLALTHNTATLHNTPSTGRSTARAALVFDTEIDGALSSILCMKAMDARQATSIGNFLFIFPPFLLFAHLSPNSTPKQSHLLTDVPGWLACCVSLFAYNMLILLNCSLLCVTNACFSKLFVDSPIHNHWRYNVPEYMVQYN